MSDTEPISFRPRPAGAAAASGQGGATPGLAGLATSPAAAHGQSAIVAFDRRELGDILSVYGRKVAAGEWRDYAIDMGRESATFSVFRRASEYPLYRIEKTPKLARKQGAYSVVTPTGIILKRGPDLKRVLAVLEKRMQLVD